MLDLRVPVPPNLSQGVQAFFLREPGVVHVSVVRGAGLDPVGDMLEADVEHASLAALVSRLEDLGVRRRGSLSFADVLDARSEAADIAHGLTRAIGSELISWDEVAV